MIPKWFADIPRSAIQHIGVVEDYGRRRYLENIPFNFAGLNIAIPYQYQNYPISYENYRYATNIARLTQLM